jgi:histone-lysine N-methyltransferase SETMAR
MELVETIPPNLRVGAKWLCEFAILHLEASVKTHRPNEGLKRLAFHEDNAPSPTATMTIATLSELGMNQMPRPPYSPDIAPSDFFLFGYLKDRLQECSYD